MTSIAPASQVGEEKVANAEAAAPAAAASPSATQATISEFDFVRELFSPIKAKNVSAAAAAFAGAAAAASLTALAYYAFQKAGVHPTFVVDPSTLAHVGNLGTAEQVDSVVKGMAQMHRFFEVLQDTHGGKATMFDFWQKLASNGTNIDEFKRTVVQHFTSLDGTQARGVIDKLLDPNTTINANIQVRLGEVIWQHDKAGVLQEVNAQEGMAFAKQGLGVALAASAAAVFTHPKIARPIQQGFEAIKASAGRVVAEIGLITDDADREIRKTVKASAFDPVEARARLAAEYTERNSSTHRFFTLTWMNANNMQDRSAMLQLFGMEKLQLGKHTSVGQAVMIDHFSAKELRELAGKEPDYAGALSGMAARREALEKAGKRPSESISPAGMVAQPVDGISELLQTYLQRRDTRASAPA